MQLLENSNLRLSSDTPGDPGNSREVAPKSDVT